MASLRDLFESLTRDPWRQRTPFSEALLTANDALIQSESDGERAEVMSCWLERFQPCLFGRIAAKKRAISFCFLTEQDLLTSDTEIAAKIQRSRLAWTRAAYSGQSSAFIVCVISGRIAEAEPNAAMQAFAQRLASLYLQVSVIPDAVFHDEAFLEFSASGATWVWKAGVNYFAANADGRWWQDHRIPAGMAFSVNSVGHLVKSGRMLNAVADVEELLGLGSGELAQRKITDLSEALEFAMRTIAMASNAVSGPATVLLPKPSTAGEPPVNLPSFLSDKDFTQYHGWYHTDFTLPTEYFRPDVERPATLGKHALDFTYLSISDVENPDFQLMGEGRRIRADRPKSPVREGREVRSQGRLVGLDDAPQLRKALALPD